MKRTFTIPAKPIGAVTIEKRTGARPRLGVRFATALDTGGDRIAEG